jgi:histidinol-phosphate aminotransferase
MLAVTRRSMFGAAGSAAALSLVGAPGRGLAAAPARAADPFAPRPGVAMLARNENPYGPSPAALKAIAELASSGCYYANGGEAYLRDMIAERHGLSPDHVLIGSGSTEVLNAATMEMTAGPAGGHILAPALFFDPPVRYAEGKGAKVVRVPLAADMGIDLDAMQRAVGPETRLVHICNPNNPTGMLLPPARLKAFTAAVSPKALVLVDEAYNELTDEPDANSLVGAVKAGDNVIVARTFSKIYGLAGLRVGYALARPDLIAKLAPWSMSVGGNTAGLAAAIASYNDGAFLAMSRARILEGRALINEAAARAGLTALPSATNFVYVKVPDAKALQAKMAAEKIIIRGPYGDWKTWSRVSTGRIEDVKRYTAALPALVGV